MRLTEPIDPYILDVMRDGDNYSPVLVCHRIQETKDVGENEYTRTYVAQQMVGLREVELLERVGPDNSGLSRITEMGETALDKYESTGETEFSFAELLGSVGGRSRVD